MKYNHDVEITLNFLKQMTNEDLKRLTDKSKNNLINIFNKWFISEYDINAFYFNSKSDELNERLWEIYERGFLE